MAEPAPYFLSDDDIKRITKKTHKAAKIKQLQAMQIPFKPDADGNPLVPRAAMDVFFGITTITAAANSDDGFKLE